MFFVYQEKWRYNKLRCIIVRYFHTEDALLNYIKNKRANKLIIYEAIA